MERFIDIVKRYPLWIAGGVVALIFVFWLSSRGSGGESVPTITSFGPSDASVNANAQVQIAQMGFNAQGASNAAALEAMAIQADVAKYTAGLDAASYEAALATSKAINEIEAGRDMTIARGFNERDIAIAQSGFQRDLDIAIHETERDRYIAAAAADVQRHAYATDKYIADVRMQEATGVANILKQQATDLASIESNRQQMLREYDSVIERAKVEGDTAARIAESQNMITLEQVRHDNATAEFAARVHASQQWFPYPNVLASMLAVPGTEPQQFTGMW